MVSLSEMAARLRTKWERTLNSNSAFRRREGKPSSPPELFESRVLLSASPVGNPVQIDANNSNGVSSGDVDKISDGRSVAVWREDADGAAQVLAQRFDASGAKTGGVIEVADGLASDAVPAVAMANDGHFIVVWVSNNTSIVGRQFQSDGTPLNTTFNIGSVQGTTPSIVVDVDMDADGDFVVAWAAGPQQATAAAHGEYAESAVFARRYAKTGTPVEDKFRVDTATNDRVYLASNPRVAVDADGDFAIGWTGIRENLVHKSRTYHYSGETYSYEYDVLTPTKMDVMLRRYQGNNFEQPAVAKAAQVVLTTTKKQTVVNIQDVDMDADGDVLVTMTRGTYRTKKVHYSGSTYTYFQLTKSELLVKRVTETASKGSAKPKAVVKTNKTSQIAGASTALDGDGDFTVAYKAKAPVLVSASGYIYTGPLPPPPKLVRTQAASQQQRLQGTIASRAAPVTTADRLLVQHFSVTNKKDGVPAQLVSTAQDGLTSFSVAGNGNGELSVVWSLGPVDTAGTFRGQRVNS